MTATELELRPWYRLAQWGVVVLGLAATSVTTALLASLYSVPVALALLVGVSHSLAIPLALRRPKLAARLAIVGVWVTVPLTMTGAQYFPWPIPVITLIVFTLTMLILTLTQDWPLPVGSTVLTLAVTTALSAVLRRIFAAPEPYPMILNASAVLTFALAFGAIGRQWLLSRTREYREHQRAESERGRRKLVEERSRIARDLHDVVAHGLSIISIQASTVRYRVPEVPEQVLVELDEITRLARESLTEMRGLLQVLRAEDETAANLTPQPNLSQIPELIETTRQSARTVNFQLFGSLEIPVSEAAALSAYRILQEALSNAVRHAPDHDIGVVLVVSEQRVELEVRNGVDPEPLVNSHGGLGLLGMRERAAVVGGTLQAESADGVFVVRASLPARLDLSG